MTSPTIRLGINNCFAVKRWGSPEEWADVIVNELGIDIYQFSLDLLPPAFSAEPARDYVAAARLAGERHGLTAHSVFTGLSAYSANLLLDTDPAQRRSAVNWYREVIDLTALLGAHGAGGHIGAFSIEAATDQVTRANLLIAEQLAMRQLADYAAVRGLEHLLFENLAVAREYGSTIEEAVSIEHAMEGTTVPWVLCLDLGHPASLTTGTESDNPVRWLETDWARTPVIQLQQSARGVDSHAPFTQATLRSGLVKREPVLDAIAQWQVDEVFLFLEVIPSHEADDRRVLQELKESVVYWQEGIDALGD